VTETIFKGDLLFVVNVFKSMIAITLRPRMAAIMYRYVIINAIVAMSACRNGSVANITGMTATLTIKYAFKSYIKKLLI